MNGFRRHSGIALVFLLVCLIAGSSRGAVEEIGIAPGGTRTLSLPREVVAPGIANAEQLLREIPTALVVSKRYERGGRTHTWDGATCGGAGVEGQAASCGSSCFCVRADDAAIYLAEVSGSGGLRIVAGGKSVASIEIGPDRPVERYLDQTEFLQPYTSLTFDGYLNTQNGNALLEVIDGEMVVTNIGDSGMDGFKVSPISARSGGGDDAFLLSGHEEWEELGAVSNRPIDSGAPVDSSMETKSTVTLSSPPPRGPGPVQIVVSMVKTASGITLTPNFSAVGATKYTYKVFSDGLVAAEVNGATAPIEAGAFPDRSAFSEFDWSVPTEITLPGEAPVDGDRLEIDPEDADQTIADVLFFDVFLKSTGSLTVGQESLFTCAGGTSGTCDDANECTTGETCNNVGGCEDGSTVPCDDGDPCTTDLCLPAIGCLPVPQFCTDLNPCTTDTCSLGDCVFTPNSEPCHDGNPCTLGDTCSGGTCQSGTALSNCPISGPALPKSGIVMLGALMLGALLWAVRRMLGQSV